MSEKQQTEGQGRSETVNDEGIKYRCGECDAEYETELITRVHISRSDDEVHADMDGLVPEANILKVNQAGEVVGQSLSSPTNIDVHRLGIDDFPSKYNKRERRALLIAAYNPEAGNYRELEDKVNGALREYGLTEFSSDELLKLLAEFYRPHITHSHKDQATGYEIRTSADDFRDLTPQQQAIIVGLLNTDLQKKLLAHDVIGCTKSYPTQVSQNRSELITTFDIRLDDESMENILAEELSDENIWDLREYVKEEIIESDDENLTDIRSFHQFWKKLNVDWQRVEGLREGEAIGEAEPPTDAPTTSQNVMSASPPFDDQEQAQSTKNGVSSSANSTTESQEETEPSDSDQQDESGEINDQLGDLEEHSTSTIDEVTGTEATDHSSTEATSANEQNSQPATSESSSPQPSQTSQPATSTQAGSEQGANIVSREKVTALQEKVQFTLDILEDEVEMGNDGAKRALAIVERIQTDFDELSGRTVEETKVESLQDKVDFTLDILEDEVEMGGDGAKRAKAIIERLRSEFNKVLDDSSA